MAILSVAKDDVQTPPPSSGPVLFCPFCREAFEGETHCPEHELLLVDFERLPKQKHERVLPALDEAVSLFEWRFGRAEMAAGALALLAGFALAPLADAHFEAREPVAWTAMHMAMGPARNLWTVAFAAVLFLVFLARRRTPLQMRGARLAGILLALMPAISLGYSLRNVFRGADATHGALRLELSWGLWPMLAAIVLLLVGSVRFGSMPHARPHEDEPRGRRIRRR